LGAVILSKLKPTQIAAALTKALASGRRKNGSGLSPRTVHHMHTVLKSALAQAVKWELLTRNPADAVDPPKIERAPMATYDVEQAAELIDAVRGTTRSGQPAGPARRRWGGEPAWAARRLSLCDLRHTRPTISGAHSSQITNRGTRGRR
jgi:hypothetical protein